MKFLLFLVEVAFPLAVLFLGLLAYWLAKRGR